MNRPEINNVINEINWTSDEIKQLRYRLGWSQAEMARSFKLELATVAAWELGQQPPQDEHRHLLLSTMHQAESNAERVQRRPIAEVMMRTRGLSQIHDFEVQNGIETAIETVPVTIVHRKPSQDT